MLHVRHLKFVKDLFFSLINLYHPTAFASNMTILIFGEVAAKCNLLYHVWEFA